MSKPNENVVTTSWNYRSKEAEDLGIIAWQYKKKDKAVWDSCGEHTYDIHKNNDEYDVRRLIVHKEK